jgi:hypothetical protein
MAVRYSGKLKISVRYDDRGFDQAVVSAPGERSWTGKIGPARAGRQGSGYDSPKAYDEVAASAISFANHARPWVGDLAEWTSSGVKIRRVPNFHTQYPPGSSRKPSRWARRSAESRSGERSRGVSQAEHLRRLRRAYRLYAAGRPGPIANVVADARKAGVPESKIQRIKSAAFKRS